MALWVADVTQFVSGDGTYTLSGFPYAGGFQAYETADGASLIVLWCDPSHQEAVRTVSIYTGAVELLDDDCGEITSVTWDHGSFHADNDFQGRWSAKYAIAVANTQQGYQNVFYLNGNFMGYMQGQSHPGPAWDHWEGDVSSGYGISPGTDHVTWQVSSDGADCIEPVLSVISVTTSDPVTDTVCGALGCSESASKAPSIAYFSGFEHVLWGQGPSALYSASGALVWRGEAVDSFGSSCPGWKEESTF